MPSSRPPLCATLLPAGLRVAVAVSGGADSVALLRRLLEERAKLGVVLSVVHVHHGIRGAEADEDAAFVAALAAEHGLPFHEHRADVPAAAAARGETLEEAARELRYAFFKAMIAEAAVDAVATAHTLDDQAETVLYKMLRGAWTEGLSGIHPVVEVPGGKILRPFLQSTHAEIEAWLRSLNQPWREDSSNRDTAYTRNRIRHQLLPSLAEFNPEIARQFSRLAAIAADEERYWQAELGRLMPSLLLPGKPVRGGGRSAGPGAKNSEEKTVSVELERLRQLHPAVRSRVLRAVALELGARLDFAHTESLLALANAASKQAGGAQVRARQTGGRLDLPNGVFAERTLREIRFTRAHPTAPAPAPEYSFAIPGEVNAPAYGILLRGEFARPKLGGPGEVRSASLRNWKAGDRATLPHSRGPKKVAEILDRLRIWGVERQVWPVVEAGGKIVWMRGIELDAPEFLFTVSTTS